MTAFTRHCILNEKIPGIKTLHGSLTYVLKMYTTSNDLLHLSHCHPIFSHCHGLIPGKISELQPSPGKQNCILKTCLFNSCAAWVSENKQQP